MTVKELREIVDNISTEHDGLDVIMCIDGPQKLQKVLSVNVGAEYLTSSVYSGKSPDELLIIRSDY